MRRHGWDIAWLCLLAAAWLVFYLGHDLARHVQPQLGVASIVCALLALAKRAWFAASAWAATATLALAPVVPNYLPHRLPLADSGCHITVVTFNHLEGDHRAPMTDDVGAARLLTALLPDVVFVQKVFDGEKFLAAMRAAGFRDFAVASSPTGQMIFSRFPIVATIDQHDDFVADVTMAGATVRLAALYAQRPVDENGEADAGRQLYMIYRDYYARLEQRVAAYKGPLILAGDGNATPFTPEVAALQRQLHDSWEEAGFGLGATFPVPSRRIGLFGPWVRIDYIFHNAAFAAIAASRVDDVSGAGHYPVSAELILKGRGDPGMRCR